MNWLIPFFALFKTNPDLFNYISEDINGSNGKTMNM